MAVALARLAFWGQTLMVNSPNSECGQIDRPAGGQATKVREYTTTRRDSPRSRLLLRTKEKLQRRSNIEVDITVEPLRGFGLKPSTTRPGGWQRAWALAAAWREQLGEGDAGAGRGGRGRVGRVGG